MDLEKQRAVDFSRSQQLPANTKPKSAVQQNLGAEEQLPPVYHLKASFSASDSQLVGQSGSLLVATLPEEDLHQRVYKLERDIRKFHSETKAKLERRAKVQEDLYMPPVVVDAAAQALLFFAGTQSQDSPPDTPFQTMARAGNAALSEYTSLAKCDVEEFAKAADSIIAQRTSTTHFASVVGLAKHVEEVLSQAKRFPKLRWNYAWELDLLEDFAVLMDIFQPESRDAD